MAAGTIVSGGFPGRVAQEVQPNPKCNGCLHFDGQAGRTGACTIGLRPWNCGDGDAADIGYAPITRGAGAYLPGMSNRSAQASQVGLQETDELTGAGSVRPVTFQQVSLGEEHVHFVKSLVSQHTTLQKSMCRLCQSSSMIGTAPPNIGYQFCTCAPIEARIIAKALVQKLSNLERSVIDLDDLTAFVYDVAKAGFKRMEKATFYQVHGKYEVTPSGKGQQHVDFHPKGGGAPHRVGTFDTHRQARHAAEKHHQRFASGTGADNAPSATSEAKTRALKVPKSAHTPPGMPSMKDAVSVAKDTKKGGGDDDELEKGDVEKSLRWSHKAPGEAKTSHGKYTVAAHPDGGHTVTYTSKETGKSHAKTFASHREALGAVTEHHIKNRPPPKPRKKKDPNAPKAPKGAGAGGCPPCP